MVNKCNICAKGAEISDDFVDLQEFSVHLECVKCHDCEKNLENQELIVEPNPDDDELIRLLCEKCAHNPEICTKCKKEIEAKKCIKIEDQILHKGCFTCAICENQLTKHYFIEGEYICNKCYQEKCFKCKKRIKDISFKSVQHNGSLIHLHVKCCKCYLCKSEDLKSIFITDDNKIICHSCQNVKNGNYCLTCLKDFQKNDKIFNLKDNFRVHMSNECFKCCKCKDTLSLDEAYFNIKPRPSLYCAIDFESLASKTKKNLHRGGRAIH